MAARFKPLSDNLRPETSKNCLHKREEALRARGTVLQVNSCCIAETEDLCNYLETLLQLNARAHEDMIYLCLGEGGSDVIDASAPKDFQIRVVEMAFRVVHDDTFASK